MLFSDFNDRAIECLRLASRVSSANDRELFRLMAFAWLGRIEHLPLQSLRLKQSQMDVPGPPDERILNVGQSAESLVTL
jgi:hypothetical protein